MSLSTNSHLNLDQKSAISNSKEKIMQNELNQNDFLSESKVDLIEQNVDQLNDAQLNDFLALTKRRCQQLEKLDKLQRTQTNIKALKSRIKSQESAKTLSHVKIRDSLSRDSIIRDFVKSSKFLKLDVIAASRKRSVRFDKISLYHEKSIREHRDYVRNLITIFRLISKNFLTKNSKIVYIMQFLSNESKKI